MNTYRTAIFSCFFAVVTAMTVFCAEPAFSLENAIVSDADLILGSNAPIRKNTLGTRLLLAQLEDDQKVLRFVSDLLIDGIFSQSRFLLTAKMPDKTFLENDNFAALEACLALESESSLYAVLERIIKESIPKDDGTERCFTMRRDAAIEGMTTYRIQSSSIKSLVLHLVVAADGKRALLAPMPVLKKHLKRKAPASLTDDLRQIRREFAGKWEFYTAFIPNKDLADAITEERHVPNSVDKPYFHAVKAFAMAVKSDAGQLWFSCKSICSDPDMATRYYNGCLMPYVELAKAMAAIMPTARGFQLNTTCKNGIISLNTRLDEASLSMLSTLTQISP